ncbi:hypothetical protein [Edaphobacter bradus]|uniref:hypothetical protein n=1 Tax=Edaphobacter bradus TaxID=2259016 RepID=UPI0021E08C04|nr:hypothetical protein [Edaphobacter bradus]
MTLFTTGDGNTPLSPDEQADLIPDLTTKEELNEGNARTSSKRLHGRSIRAT